jgi:hypothetical protein
MDFLNKTREDTQAWFSKNLKGDPLDMGDMHYHADVEHCGGV